MIMEEQNLPFLPMAWEYRAEDKAKKLIVGIIYKYICDRMYENKVVAEKYGINPTTMHHHIVGKKYAGSKSSTICSG